MINVNANAVSQAFLGTEPPSQRTGLTLLVINLAVGELPGSGKPAMGKPSRRCWNGAVCYSEHNNWQFSVMTNRGFSRMALAVAGKKKQEKR